MASDKAYYDPRNMGSLSEDLLLLLKCFVILWLWSGIMMRGCFNCIWNHYPHFSPFLLYRKRLRVSQQGRFRIRKPLLHWLSKLKFRKRMNKIRCMFLIIFQVNCFDIPTRIIYSRGGERPVGGPYKARETIWSGPSKVLQVR